MEIEAINANSFEVTRGSLNTSASSHGSASEVVSYYRLQGQPLNIARYLLSSDPDAPFYSEGQITQALVNTPSEITPNAIYFDFNLEKNDNIQVGDTCTITNASNPVNNVSSIIVDVETVDFNTRIILNDDVTLIAESGGALCSFASQYNVWPIGVGIPNDQIDLNRFNFLETLIDVNHPEMDIVVPEEIQCKEFLETEIYKPVSLYFVPREGKISITATLPPLGGTATPRIDENTISSNSIPNITTNRSLNKNNFNVIAYKFNESRLEQDKFKSGVVYVSEDAFNRIPIKKRKTLKIEAKALRENIDTRDKLEKLSSKALQRYRFGALYVRGVDIQFGEGFNIDIGDTVIFGSDGLKIPNLESGEDVTKPQLFEVVNKSFNLQNGKIKVDLLNSNFSNAARYVTFGPGSKCISKNDKELTLTRSFGTDQFSDETEKYEQYLGASFRIRNEDFSIQQTVTLNEISASNPNILIFRQTITIAVDDTFVIEFAEYPELNDTQKLIHGSFTPQVEITGVVDEQNITVSLSDITKFYVDAPISVHNDDFTDLSDESTVATINLGTGEISLNKVLTYLPAIGDKIDLVGFSSDESAPYRFF